MITALELGGRLPNDQRSPVWLITGTTDGGKQLLDCLAFIDLDRQTRPDGNRRDAA